MASLLVRYADRILGTLTCFDRLLISGTLVEFCHAAVATDYLKRGGIRIFEFEEKFAVPIRDEIRARAEEVAKENGLTVEYIRRGNLRKEDRVQRILEARGTHPGLVHVFSALESHSAGTPATHFVTGVPALCDFRGEADPPRIGRTSGLPSSPPAAAGACGARSREICAPREDSEVQSHTGYRPWHDKAKHDTCLLPRQGQCLHYYFYFVDEEFGLCHLRVPTWAPFRVEFMMNGHDWLALRLEREGIGFTLADNGFLAIDDLGRAQAMAEELTGRVFHRFLDRVAKRYCPYFEKFVKGYHWSTMQAELSTDILFRRRKVLGPVYDQLLRSAIQAVKADDVATFLGRKITAACSREVMSDLRLRIEGRRIRHQMGPASVKMYDKRGVVLRIETMMNDVSFFKHDRQVEHRKGRPEMKYAALKKTIHSLGALREAMDAANRRYLAFTSELEDPSPAIEPLKRLTQRVREKRRTYRGFNFFDPEHLALFSALARGEFTISGFRNADLRGQLPACSPGKMARILKRLRLHGVIRKVRDCYKYYLTDLGRRVVATGLRLRTFTVTPSLIPAAGKRACG